MMKPKSKFIKVRCKDCENEQVIFDRANTSVSCHICGSKLVIPKGGKAEIKAEVLEVLE